MYAAIQQRIHRKYKEVVQNLFGIEPNAPAFDFPPRLEMGDLSIAACFELAKQLRQPPRKIAEQVAGRLMPIEGIERVSVAGAGYLNFHLDRPGMAQSISILRESTAPQLPARPGKVLVEHTSINPNKAAHIGHLRNAVLGDSFVRLLRFRGYKVEVQNYIDNTGVQVADVVVGFKHLEKKNLEDVKRLIEDAQTRFDYYCWDLYARISRHYQENKDALAIRAHTLKEIEEGHGETAEMAKLISTAIVRLHLETMRRVNVRYDLLVEESEILRLDFWKAAFEKMKEIGAIRYATGGKNAGCWVMDLGATEPEEPEEGGTEDVKIIVRSNGTVTYVGKDIAYHMWKFALLGKDFAYAPFYRYPDGHDVWHTSTESRSGAPEFGRASAAYAVIDTRQAYLQNIVAAAFRALGFHAAAEHLHHFSYEVVGLSPACAREMGFELGAEDLERRYVEVSGRKGLGLKADDLIDMLTEKAREEVGTREMTKDPVEQSAYARMIAVGSLRYFLLKFSCRVTITFDFREALAFEGETGPYLQYTIVRARNIFRKYADANPDFQTESLSKGIESSHLKDYFSGEDGAAFWELVTLAAQLELAADQAITTTEPAVVAKYAFRLAQSFNNFYHRFHILSESDSSRQTFLLYLVRIVERTLTQTLDLLGIEVPERM